MLAAIFQTYGNFISGLFNSIKQWLSGIIEFISGVFTGDWTKAWEGVKDIFKGIWNGIITAVEYAINFIINGINLLISALNTIHFEVPDWVPLIGGRSFGISIPLVSNVALPRLAQGAVIPPNREFLAVLGDQKSGTNIETPLATMVQAFKQAMNETGGMGGRSITVVMQVDKREFARAVYQAKQRRDAACWRSFGGGKNMTSVLSLDGKAYPNLHVVSLKRSFSVLDGDNAGRVMTGAMTRDIIGTYYNYSLEIDSVTSNPEEYDEFYETISAPADSHVLTVPYAQTTMTFDAYVANGDDELASSYAGKNSWQNLTVNFVAMKPKRTPA